MRNIRTRVPARNWIIHLPGAKGETKNAATQLDFFSVFMSDAMVEKIVLHTNEKNQEDTNLASHSLGQLTQLKWNAWLLSWFSVA